MAAVWINTGTISISEGGTTVTGSGTSFLTGGTQKGDMFQAPDGREYEITNIVSDTQLSIFKAYQGTTVSGSTNWDIIPTQGYVKALVDEVREYVETNNTIVDEISITGLSIAHGGTGATTASEARTNLGLGNIDNTSDANKPISTATQTALNSKANASHTHDDRYYTETEVDSLLAGKSNTGHTHDDRYYTETEITAFLEAKSDTSHTHDDRYYTETEVDGMVSSINSTLSTKSNTSHTHDDRYYTETEITSLLSGKADASALSAHTGNTNNPHSVTAEQVGAYTKSETDALRANDNLLINSAGLINQRGYVSGTPTTAANQYTLDRWRIVVSGQNLTFSTSENITTFTAPAGGIEQVVENLNIQGGSYVLSFDGTAMAKVAQSSDNSTYSTVAPSNGVYAITAGYYVRIRFSDGTFCKPKFERGNISTPFILDNYISDLQACRRYYLSLMFVLYVYGAYANYGGSIVSMGIDRMRVNPTISYSSISSWGWVGAVNNVLSSYHDNSILFHAGVMQTNPGAYNRIQAVMVAEL